MLIRIAGIEPESIVDGEGIRYVVFTQGCPHHCFGCHNPQTHAVDGGKLMDVGNIINDIRSRKDYIDGITLSGGEPFCQVPECAAIARAAHDMGLSVWCYTGYLFEQIYLTPNELLATVDVLVDGPFMQEERSIDLEFCGSRNQRVIDVPASLKAGKVVLRAK